jgi:hypothetical protein
VVDVAVAEGALRRGDGIVTSDAEDIRKVVVATRRRIHVEVV